MFSKLLSILLVTICVILICKAASIDLKSSEENVSEEVLVLTETHGFWKNKDAKRNTTLVHWGNDTSETSDDDVIEINVGGEIISTLRSTLTAVPKSKLAKMFMKNNETELYLRDNMGAVFFDYNPVQFNYLLDQLRTIKRNPEIPAYAVDFQAPNEDLKANFTAMIIDFQLNPDAFLSPMKGVHLSLTTNSLIGWDECYRSTYDMPLDLKSLVTSCKSVKLLVGCRPTENKTMLTLAGVGQWNDLVQTCASYHECQIEMEDNIGFYYVSSQAWGFAGRPETSSPNSNPTMHLYNGKSRDTLSLNPCDSSSQYSEYRLCWSLRSSSNRGGGDRCGSMKNLHNDADWERIVYRAI
ncbi:unnamed protein product [Rotaria magnacalcarata]|uniref:Potassium channel tetramerisation-type BTB domain-containing protein n=3 Tax=Rotaria magnacalcarata TaxID=392030 RepID=A0A816PZT1_9BILA|nr:unnamed protein product [Rotaria magnacalcarata]CAF2054825.1 unnamed protein product [Rotaria magnacalcarata]CAF2152076.1 unnamed protein product [Rotaria magnacalcarata]CAF3984579.1 unnamed protein product [Rotaria magnacalcarata]CAF4064035.1 unnamed protein product [Rotaria magnacalcarata]